MFFQRWITYSLIISNCFAANVQASSGVDGNIADYVIVGVGTAGAVLARKLTDDKKTSVIALHTGENFTNSFILKYSKNTIFSVLAGLLGGTPTFDPMTLDLPPDVKQQLQDLIQLTASTSQPLYESGMTIPQPDADNRELLWILPLPFGGGTSVNAGAWCRGTNQLYSQWETIAGPEWSVANILATFKELENYHGSTTNPPARGYHGLLHIRQDFPVSKLAQTFSNAIVNATGFPFVLDYNDPNTPIGVSSQLQLTHRGDDGFYRVSSPTAFLGDDVIKKNGKGVNGRKLQVLFNSMGLRTIWDGTKAIGVQYVQDGVTKSVFANKGVIVCAGLRSSPFLLNSGVGPSGLLNSLSIPVIYDNPNVGQGLADQPHVITVFSSNPNDSVAGSNSVFSQISWLPAPEGDPTSRQLRLTTVDAIPGITLALLDLCQPLSRGSVSINSANPLAPPVIDLGELTNSNDLALYISGFQNYIKNINIQIQTIDPQYRLIFPDPAIIDDVGLLTAFIRESIDANMHFQSHCRMAPLGQGGVVNSSGQVYGVQNLYVADNSIVPQCMDGSPMASAYLIAAMIARLLGY